MTDTVLGEDLFDDLQNCLRPKGGTVQFMLDLCGELGVQGFGIRTPENLAFLIANAHSRFGMTASARDERRGRGWGLFLPPSCFRKVWQTRWNEGAHSTSDGMDGSFVAVRGKVRTRRWSPPAKGLSWSLHRTEKDE